MGIKNLAKLLSDEAPDSLREVELSSLHGRKIAIDASMAIYQFLIAIRQQGGPQQAAVQLTNADGETTSHIQGMFNRTIRFMQEGIKPVFVFDGKPPEIKSHELVKRRERREKAQAALQQATEDGNVEELDKQNKRLVRAGHKENEDCRKLLGLMGVPVMIAPCEAEAQAAALAKAGSVYATGTEDMDALTFCTPVLVRKMTFANNSKAKVQTIHYQKALDGLELTAELFVDLCILLGCDYTDSIRGVGPKTALKLIRQYGSIEKILENIDQTKYTVPESWLPNKKEKENTDESDREESDPAKTAAAEEEEEEVFLPAYVQARKLFTEHPVEDKVQLKWKPCDEAGLIKFLVDEMGFNAERVKASIQKLQAAYKAHQKPQTRMDSFFPVKANPNAAKNAAKRKADQAAAAKAAAAKKKKKR